MVHLYSLGDSTRWGKALANWPDLQPGLYLTSVLFLGEHTPPHLSTVRTLLSEQMPTVTIALGTRVRICDAGWFVKRTNRTSDGGKFSMSSLLLDW